MPADYVHKLARMFQDIKISEDLNQQFKEEYRKTKGSIAGIRINRSANECLLVKFTQISLNRFHQHKNSECRSLG